MKQFGKIKLNEKVDILDGQEMKKLKGGYGSLGCFEGASWYLCRLVPTNPSFSFMGSYTPLCARSLSDALEAAMYLQPPAIKEFPMYNGPFVPECQQTS